MSVAAPGIAHLNGSYVELAQARVSPMDRGFLFGDGVYEVIPVYSRRPFRLDEHLLRLQTTMAAIRIPDPHSSAGWKAIVAELVARNPWDDQAVYLQVTRGAESRRNHAFPGPDVRPTVFGYCEPMGPPDEVLHARGVAAVSAADIRWMRCDLKAVSLLANCLLRQHAVDQGCAETVLFRDGFLTEGAVSSIFVCRNGVLLAPPRSHLMLPGITYDVVLEIARARGLPFQVREVLETEVRSADEVWLTSSSREVLAITTLDGRAVGAGVPGPMVRQMQAWYQEFKRTEMRDG